MALPLIEQLESRFLFAVPVLNAVTSWLGNTFPAAQPASANTWVPAHVPDYANDMFVAADGTVFCNSGYDEGQANCPVYKLDPVTGKLMMIDAPGGGGGYAVTANSTRWFRTVGTYITGATYGGAVGTDIATQLPGSDIRGLAASDTEVYVADAATQTVYVLDAATLHTTLRSFPVNNPNKLALDQAGNLWVIENRNGGAGVARVACYTSTGTFLGAITDLVLPTALAIDRATGQLIVSDDGPAQQLRYYDVSMPAHPTFVKTFGDYGGIYGGAVPGAVGPHRFNFAEGIGVDGAGRIYVANNGWARGLSIEAYASDGTLLSSVVGLSNIIDNAAYDASTDSIFGNDERYSLDWSAPPGQEATYAATVGNEILYPDDPRYHNLVNLAQGVRVVQGHRLLVETNLNASALSIYRQGPGESWAPSALLDTDARYADSEAYPNAHPLMGSGFSISWLWRDANGNGAFDAGEYQEDPLSPGGTFIGAQQIWMDDAGNLWDITGSWAHALREFPLQGFDDAGNPIYTFSTVVDSAAPAPLAGNSLYRIQYDSTSDTMYLMGSTDSAQYVLVRYDHWSNTNQRSIHAGFPLTIPTGVNGVANNWPESWSVAGNYVFVGYSRQSYLEVYDVRNGSYVGEMQNSPSVGDASWVDAPGGINAFKRANNEYEIFKEEDFGNKVVWFRWTPPGTPPTFVVSGAPSVTQGATYTLHLSSNDPHRTVTSWSINWGDGSPAQVIAGNPATITHSYGAAAGNYTVSATGSDDAAGTYASNSMGLTVTPPPDGAVPTAALTAPVTGVVAGGGATQTFSITYSDNVAIDASTLGDDDIFVTGPGGYSQFATLVDVNPGGGNAASLVATYQITAPGGSWDWMDDGLYTIHFQGGSVTDTSGSGVGSGVLGTFAANVPIGDLGTISGRSKEVVGGGVSPALTYIYAVTLTQPLKVTLKMGKQVDMLGLDVLDAAQGVIWTKSKKTGFSTTKVLGAGTYYLRVRPTGAKNKRFQLTFGSALTKLTHK
jgi:hypothetical protein